ncbi:MAG: hypothetical protein JST27_01010 [Bacteroidetes bacterium]|nr:hypothetical protein [Bacteroidota bacterium]
MSASLPQVPSSKGTFQQVLRQWVLFPFLFPLFFVLRIARYYFGAVPAWDVIWVAALWTIPALLLYFLLRKVFRNRLSAAVATLLLLVLLLAWHRILNPLYRLFHSGENYRYLPFIFLGFLLVITSLCLLLRKLRPVAASALLYYLNTLFLVFVVVELGLIGYYSIQRSLSPGLFFHATSEQATDRSARAGSNIYLLLFDEYSSTSVLKEKWDYDNSTMDSFLKAKGFFVNENSRSNYCWTEFSMASLFNLDYFRNFSKAHNLASEQDMQRSIVAMEQPRLTQVLKHAGYAIRCHSIFQVDTEAPEYIPELRLNKWRLLTVNSFFHALRVNYWPYLKHRTAIKEDPTYRFLPFYRMDNYNQEGVQFVFREARLKEQQPRFVYAHFFMPHNTYYYDRDDRLMTQERIEAIQPVDEPKYYGYNVTHTNKKLRLMIDSIQAQDPKACIIVLGDHGYRQHLYEDDRHSEYFRNMSALYFPDKNYSSLPDSFTNVNVFRIVLNKICSTHYPLLPNHSYPLTLKPN